LESETVRALLDSAPDGMVIVDDSGRIVMVNNQAEALFGYERAELVGLPVEALIPEQQRQVHTAHRLRYRASPKVRAMGAGLGLRGQRRDGTEFPVEVSLSPVPTASGNRVIAAVRDVSERAAAEASNRVIRHAIDAIHDGVFMVDADTLEFTYVNRGATRQTGYDRDELLAMTPVHIAPQFSTESFRRRLEPLLTGATPVVDVKTVLRRNDGVDVPVELTMQYPLAATPDDPRVVVVLARDVSAQVTAENERARRQAILEALAEVRSGLLSSAPVQDTLELICRHARNLAEADGVMLSRPDLDEGVLRHVAFDSHESQRAMPAVLLVDDLMGEVLAGQPALSTHLPSDHRIDQRNRQAAAGVFMSAIVAPVEGRNGVDAVLFLGRAPGRDPFTDEHLTVITSFAGQAAAAMELDRTRQDLRALEMVGERERIAGDLHDLVIQRLFAAGLGLQAIQNLIPPGRAADRVDATITELDKTISEIRSTIFQLNRPSHPAAVHSQLLERIAAGCEALGFVPGLEVEGDAQAIQPVVLEQLLPSLNEILANVAKHASATTATVRLTIGDHEIELVVADNGIGIPDNPSPGRGLTNLDSRARRLGGSFGVTTAGTGGTIARWSVPH
jgi:PAS domain S-box-containing protein